MPAGLAAIASAGVARRFVPVMSAEPQWGSWDEHIDWLVDKYEEEQNVRVVAEEAGISYMQAYKRLRNAGVDTSSDYSKSGPDNPLYEGASE
jgi:hypothetical protein